MLAGYAAATAHGLYFRSTLTALKVDTGGSDSASTAVSRGGGQFSVTMYVVACATWNV